MYPELALSLVYYVNHTVYYVQRLNGLLCEDQTVYYVRTKLCTDC